MAWKNILDTAIDAGSPLSEELWGEFYGNDERLRYRPFATSIETFDPGGIRSINPSSLPASVELYKLHLILPDYVEDVVVTFTADFDEDAGNPATYARMVVDVGGSSVTVPMTLGVNTFQVTLKPTSWGNTAIDFTGEIDGAGTASLYDVNHRSIVSLEFTTDGEEGWVQL